MSQHDQTPQQAGDQDLPSGKLVGPAATFGNLGGQASVQVPELDGRISDLLDGQKIALTGVTGFIGEQVLWKVLTELPGTSVAVLVRPKGSLTPEHRVRTLLNRKIFEEARHRAGGLDALMDRVQVIAGDLPNVPELPRDIDVLVHCAGDVSFDPPIDEAFRTNVLGTSALLRRFIESASDANGRLERIPHYVHVSTAYTAGRRRGAIPETSHEHDVDHRVETEAALAVAESIRRASRSPEQLTRLRRQAEADHQRAGYLTTAADTERRRQEWIRSELVKAGTERARSLGWTDVYTFAKAMAERAVEEIGADIRVSIVRPAIVESSLRLPHPGWIEGFKMAEPIILSYARGELPEFPASPESVLDIIPADMVTNAIVTVAATKPEVGRVQYYHSSSGARNPLTFLNIYNNLREYLGRKPFVLDGEPVPLATWKFPGFAPIERAIDLGEWANTWGNRLLRFAPRSATVRSAAIKLDKQRGSLDFYRKYLTLYGEYLQSQLHFVDDATMALHRQLHPDDAERFGFDSASFGWRHYLQDVHFPAVLEPVQRLETMRKKREARSATFRPLKAGSSETIAVFDLDGTVMATNVVETYLWAKFAELGPVARVKETAAVLGRLPRLIGAERRDRTDLLRSIYRRYAGMSAADLDRRIDSDLASFIADRTAPDAIARIQEHRDAGHTTILLTGELRPFTRPLAHLFDVVVASDLEVGPDGRFTGFLQGPPMVGESRSAWLRHYGNLHDVDLAHSFAYADSQVDLPMLNVVGQPVAVSPDVGLLRAARQRGWSVVNWPISAERRRWLP